MWKHRYLIAVLIGVVLVFAVSPYLGAAWLVLTALVRVFRFSDHMDKIV